MRLVCDVAHVACLRAASVTRVQRAKLCIDALSAAVLVSCARAVHLQCRTRRAHAWTFCVCGRSAVLKTAFADALLTMTRSVCTCTPLCVRDGADTAAFCTPSRNSRCSAGPHRSASLTSRRRRSDHLVCCASAATLSPVEASAHLLPSVEFWSYDSAGARRQGLTGATPPYSGLHASRVEPVEACAVPAVEDPRNWACRAQLPAVSTALRSDRVAAGGFATFDTALDVPPWLASEADGQPVPAPPGSSGGGGGGKENEYYLQARARPGGRCVFRARACAWTRIQG